MNKKTDSSTTTDRRLVSAVVPIYNAGKYVGETLDCLCGQTHKNLEIVCVLDAPTDDSEAIVKKYAAADSRVKIVRHEKNKGLPAARNAGAKAATGEWLHFMDADDLINPEFYERLLACAAAGGESVDVAACEVFYEKKPRRGVRFGKPEILTGGDKFSKTEVFFRGWAWRWLIRREFWIGHGLEFPNLVPMEDKPAMIQMIYHAAAVALCPAAEYRYKNRGDSILNRKYDADREKLRHENRREARRIIREFARARKIKKPNKLLHYIRHLI